jgi:hypothetical protein
LLALSSRIDLALYRGEPDRVTERIVPEMKGIRGALVDRPPLQGMMLRFALVRHAVARALASPAAHRDALADARKHTRALRSKLPLVRCSRTICEAMIDEMNGDNGQALRRYQSSLPELERSGAVLFLQAVRYRIGKLQGGDEGAALCTEIKTWLAREGVRDPDRMLAMLLPGPN